MNDALKLDRLAVKLTRMGFRCGEKTDTNQKRVLRRFWRVSQQVATQNGSRNRK